MHRNKCTLKNSKFFINSDKNVKLLEIFWDM